MKVNMTAEFTNYILRGWFSDKPNNYLERVIAVSAREDANEALTQAAEDFKQDWPDIKRVSWEKM